MVNHNSEHDRFGMADTGNVPRSPRSAVPAPHPQSGFCYRYIPFLVLLVTLFLSYQTWKNTRLLTQQELQLNFDHHTKAAYDNIIRRMAAYEQVLRGVQGFFEASRSVSKHEFAMYIATLRLEESYPGIQGIGFAPQLRHDRKAAHIAAMRAEGFHSYTLWPVGTRRQYAPVIYLEPTNERNRKVFGYDLLSESSRREALERARDNGTAALTAKLQLVQEGSRNPQPGCIMYLPVYRHGSAHRSIEQRRAELAGWVSAPFRMNDLMVGILGPQNDTLDIEIYDGNEISDKALLYDNDTARHTSGPAPRFQSRRSIEIGGRQWTMITSSMPGFEKTVHKRELTLVAVASIGGSLLLSLITWLLVSARSNALRAAYNARLTAHALQEAEKLAQIGHFDYDPRSDKTYWSEGLERIWGLEPGNHYRQFKEFLATVHPDDLQIILDSDADKSWHETNNEYRIIRADGEIRHIYSYGYRESAPDGTITRVFGINQDITERKRAEEAIIRSRDYYLQLLENFPSLIWRAGLDGKCDYFNRTWLAFTGRSMAQELGYGWAEGVHADDLPACLSTYYAAFESRRSFTMEYRLRHHDGSYHWIVDHGSPHLDAEGCFIGYIGSCYDINAQKNAELALKETHEQLEQRVAERTAALTEANQQLLESRTLLKNTQQQARLGSWSWDIASDRMTWSDELYAIFGWSRDLAAPGYHQHGMLFTPHSYACLDNAFARVLATGEAGILDLELEIVRTDGIHRFCLLHGEAVQDDTGAIVQLRGSLQDITERKQLEEQLFEARKLESIGQIAAGVAHEVRTPLNAILSITEALFHQPQIGHNPEYDQFLHHIRTQVNRLSLLMNDLLALGKPIPASSLHPVPLSELCRDTISIWQQSATGTARPVDFQSHISGTATVLVDGIKLQQALFNLLENASQHSPARSAITVALTTVPSREMACIRISDAGNGIPLGQLDKVFEPFYSNRKGGTGLGLALVKHFIENMGGTVRLWNNDPPPGCSAEVCVPLRDGDSA
ncbi:CHASE domain-containing protein [Trichlorobacter lovleyi]|uniref:CHASE domain-containing protein n=1 Tax=Trichlorobacter lovleyi TaxID=313985 RepID=UPI00247FB05D|nr:CHASE domain-containing protein [Trichlorobacter lovleyi]